MKQFSKPKTYTLLSQSTAGTGSWFKVDPYMDFRTVIIDLTAGDTITLELCNDNETSPLAIASSSYTADTVVTLTGPFARIRVTKTGTTGTATVVMYG